VRRCQVTRDTSRSICSASRLKGTLLLFVLVLLVLLVAVFVVSWLEREHEEDEVPAVVESTPTSLGHANLRSESLTNPPSDNASSRNFHKSTVGSDKSRRISSALAAIAGGMLADDVDIDNYCSMEMIPCIAMVVNELPAETSFASCMPAPIVGFYFNRTRK